MNNPEDNQQVVILVDEQDNEVGVCGKLAAHRDARLHRAVSVLLFNSRKEWLIQKRADGKYHSGGLWSNTCCSHPEPGESALHAARRTLLREMHIKCALEELFTCTYDLRLNNGLSEREFNHVFSGRYEGVPDPEASEVGDWKWVGTSELAKQLEQRPELYTAWFRLIFGNFQDHASSAKKESVS